MHNRVCSFVYHAEVPIKASNCIEHTSVLSGWPANAFDSTIGMGSLYSLLFHSVSVDGGQSAFHFSHQFSLNEFHTSCQQHSCSQMHYLCCACDFACKMRQKWTTLIKSIFKKSVEEQSVQSAQRAELFNM